MATPRQVPRSCPNGTSPPVHATRVTATQRDGSDYSTRQTPHELTLARDPERSGGAIDVVLDRSCGHAPLVRDRTDGSPGGQLLGDGELAIGRDRESVHPLRPWCLPTPQRPRQAANR